MKKNTKEKGGIMKAEKVNQIANKTVLFAYGGLIAISTCIVIQLLGLSQLDRNLVFSLYCFTVAIPGLSATMYIFYYESLRGVTSDDLDTFCSLSLLLLSPIIAIIGLGGVFFHFSKAAGYVFIISCFISLLALILNEVKVNKFMKKLKRKQ
ncbi:hypothetical protein KAI78_05655 [bacterium]|nr:hypothetical protein [bacterium]